MSSTARRMTLIAAVAAMMAAPAMAEQTSLSVVGSWSSLPLHKQYEAPYWTEKLPAAAAGKIAVEMTTFDQMGVAGGDVYRLLGDGVFDIGMTVADYTVGDAPELEGLDVPLVATTADSARAMVDAARPMVEDIMRDRFNAKLLAIAPYPPQIVFCNAAITGLDDLKGKKVRGSGRMTTKLLEALGAEGVNVAFSEVPGALERGVVDCAVTGGGSGYSAGWWEVSTHLIPVPLGGWDAVVTAINRDKWESLPKEAQDVILATIKTDFEDVAWGAADGALATDIACLTGKGECPLGKAAKMALVEASPADMEKARAALTGTVLPDWAGRAGKDWAQRWNDSVGKTVGVAIPLE